MLYVLHITVLCMQHVRGLLALCCSINNITETYEVTVITVADLEGAPFGRLTDAVTHGHVS